jgi:hypothetical protein
MDSLLPEILESEWLLWFSDGLHAWSFDGWIAYEISLFRDRERRIGRAPQGICGHILRGLALSMHTANTEHGDIRRGDRHRLFPFSIMASRSLRVLYSLSNPKLDTFSVLQFSKTARTT